MRHPLTAFAALAALLSALVLPAPAAAQTLEKRELFKKSLEAAVQAVEYYGELDSPDELRKLGVDPDQIDICIFTHLHWDHCANMGLFRNATFFVHSRELDFALDPHVLYEKSYESERLGVTRAKTGIAG